MQNSLKSSLGASSSRISGQNSAPIEFHFLSLFPEALQGILQSSLLGKAWQKGLVSFHFTQIRDFSRDRHRTVDDAPYGGGEGVIIKADVLYEAWKSVAISVSPDEKVITLLLSPQGNLFTQTLAQDFIQYTKFILVCGHYEGIDERFIDLCVDQEVSIGDYVLTGGELPALVVVDTIARLIPGVIGNERSLTQESLENGLLKYPQYTRPREFQGMSVPEVLLSGNHKVIDQWRSDQRQEVTRLKRPDLWRKFRENS